MFSNLDVLGKQLGYLAFLCEVLDLSADAWTSERWELVRLVLDVDGINA